MREVIFNAEVGDRHLYGEDPSINELEAYSAELFGKEGCPVCHPVELKAITLAILLSNAAGERSNRGKQCPHFLVRKAAAGLRNWRGVQLHPVPGTRGVMTGADVEG